MSFRALGITEETPFAFQAKPGLKPINIQGGADNPCVQLAFSGGVTTVDVRPLLKFFKVNPVEKFE